MSVLTKLSALVLTEGIDRAARAVGVGEVGRPLVAFLRDHLTDHGQKLPAALRAATDRAWTALEVALAGDTLWQRCNAALAGAEDKAFRRQVRSFLDAAVLDGDADRRDALAQLRSARNCGVLTGGGIDAGAVAGRVADFARYANPTRLLAAEWQAADGLGEDLRADYPALARVVSARPADGMPILVVAARYFFRRQVEADPELFRGMAVAQLDRLTAAQEEGYAALDAALAEQGDRLHSLLADVREVVVETHGAVLDLQGQVEGQSEQVRQIAQAVEKLLDQHQLARRELRPGDSLSIRNDRERDLVKQLVARYRSLPEGDRRGVPALLNAVGKLEVVAGDFDAARNDFQAVALLEQDNKGKAEAHYNAYLASLEKRDWPGAVGELVKAVKLDPKRFAPFPTGKYQPVRILGAGGFGVAFLCKHKLMDAQVVIKTLLLDDLGRDADKVFTEAQVLRQLDHPAVIRISDCGYVDAAKKSRPFLVMDYFEGGTLEEHVQKHGPLPVPDLLAVARRVAEGLHAAHEKGILHRDVKPANLLVRKEGAGWKAKVIDFGLAQRQKVARQSTDASTATRSKTLVGGSIAGTLDYGPPEQMGKRADPVGAYSDVYGWAKTCCYALFRTTQPTLRHWQSVPGPLADLLGRCLEDDPKARPADFAEVLAGLDGMNDAVQQANRVRPAVAEEFAELSPAPRRSKRPSKASRLPLLIGGAVVAVLLVAVLAVVASGMLRSGSAQRPTAGTVVKHPESPARPPNPAGPFAGQTPGPPADDLPGPVPDLGWTPLFNGKDLAGWRSGPNDKTWAVRDGLLTGSGPPGLLVSNRGDFRNVHLRAEVKINDGGNSGVFVRVPPSAGFTDGYEADINSTHMNPLRTGSLRRAGKEAVAVNEVLVGPGQWFTYEVIADGSRVTVKVNGKTTADFTDPQPLAAGGHVAIQQHNPATVVQFRKIEIRDIAGQEAGWVPLFNGKDLTNFYTYLGTVAEIGGAAKKDSRSYGKNNDPEGVFTVREGVLRISGKGFGGLVAEKEYENYHLKVEYRWGDKTWPPRESKARNSGILVHCAWSGDEILWPRSFIECQMVEGGTGDLIPVGEDTQQLSVEAERRGGQIYFKPGATAITQARGRFNWFARDPAWKDVKGFRGERDVERPAGEWNTLECICDGDKITAILNGTVVNVGNYTGRAKGTILIQSQGAEIFFRKIEIKRLSPASAGTP